MNFNYLVVGGDWLDSPLTVAWKGKLLCFSLYSVYCQQHARSFFKIISFWGI